MRHDTQQRHGRRASLLSKPRPRLLIVSLSLAAPPLSFYTSVTMPVRLRLQRFGRTHSPFYRMVAADSRAPRDGKFLEIVRMICCVTCFAIYTLRIPLTLTTFTGWNLQSYCHKGWNQGNTPQDGSNQVLDVRGGTTLQSSGVASWESLESFLLHHLGTVRSA